MVYPWYTLVHPWYTLVYPMVHPCTPYVHPMVHPGIPWCMPLCIMVGIPPCVYASQPSFVGRYTRPCRCCCSRTTVRCTRGVCAGITLLVLRLERGGLCAEECASPNLRINRLPARKRTRRDQETRHRKHPCTRTSGIPQLLLKCSPAPSRKRAAF